MNFQNNIINVTANKNGDIFSSDLLKPNFLNIFNEYNLLEKYQHILIKNIKTKKLIINIFASNYSVFVVPLKINESQFYQYYFEEWKLCPIFKKSVLKVKNYNPDLKNINSYTPEERQIIFALILGYILNKELFNFINQRYFIKESRIDYIIRMLHKRFSTNNRSELIDYLKFYELDKYLPENIFPSGIYDIDLKLIMSVIK